MEEEPQKNTEPSQANNSIPFCEHENGIVINFVHRLIDHTIMVSTRNYLQHVRA